MDGMRGTLGNLIKPVSLKPQIEVATTVCEINADGLENLGGPRKMVAYVTGEYADPEFAVHLQALAGLWHACQFRTR
jgi:hypothetical protein